MTSVLETFRNPPLAIEAVATPQSTVFPACYASSDVYGNNAYFNSVCIQGQPVGGGTTPWEVIASGAWCPNTDATYDIGTVSDLRPYNIYCFQITANYGIQCQTLTATFGITATQGIQVGNGNTILNAPHLLGGVGVPAVAIGSNGDYYFRQDGAASAHIYFKSAGAWTAIV